jgi:hypothetical protein
VDGSGNITNAEDFSVEQSVDVSNCTPTSSPTPNPTTYPSGVAIDTQQNIAAVTLFGCNSLALINLSTGTGKTVDVGTNPMGVAVIPRLHLAVVANNGSSNASIVDELGASVLNSPATGSGSMGAAADQETAEVAIANSVANTVTVVNAITGGTNTISTGQRPVAVAFNYVDHQVAVATTGGNGGIGAGDGASLTINPSLPVSLPTSVVYDPVPSDCNLNNNTGATNTVGCFLVTSSTNDNLEMVDPISSQQVQFRVGINPTAVAYNFLTSTVVSTNTLSHTVTVADFLGQRIRAVLTLPPSPVNSSLALSQLPQFALDIHPLTNMAVIADTANGRVLFIPLPR